MDIWDGYANWSEVAAKDSFELLKQKITGAADWRPNYFSPGLMDVLRQLGADAVLADFGCGLGRNAAVLRGACSRLVGLDLPEMIARLRAPELAPAAGLYDALYDDVAVLARAEPVDAVYDSVMFQHILHEPTVEAIMGALLAMPGFAMFVTLKNQKVAETLAQRVLREAGWRTTLAEVDEKSFQGAHYGIKHDLVVARRPG